MKDLKNNSPEEAKHVINKVAAGERASLGDQPLTPERKMAAEKARMQQGSHQAESRKEEDRQKATLGGPVLTPSQKVKNELSGHKPHRNSNK